MKKNFTNSIVLKAPISTNFWVCALQTIPAKSGRLKNKVKKNFTNFFPQYSTKVPAQILRKS